MRRERSGEALHGDVDAVAAGDVGDDERVADLQRLGQADPLPVEDALRAHLHAQRGRVRRERTTEVRAVGCAQLRKVALRHLLYTYTLFRYLAVRSSSTPSTASAATVSRVSNVGGAGGHCGLEIVGVEDRDRGSWECEVGAVINDDFTTETDNIVLDVKSKFHI